ncbi:type IVB secretion system protein IcmH/DotU [Candidatus Curculioniphilus buchneri]|uniref:type IVB secretion system protein IcmH/DotU n=1 Tax=Candidatus Curculioniphilus buchneri TaxID=690594 RepID=UPI00376EE371
MREAVILPMSYAMDNNPLVCTALPLLNALSNFYYISTPIKPTLLRQKLINEIYNFEKQCQGLDLDYEVIIGARYCLCTALDEAIALTKWGQSDIWTGKSLLLVFHNETSGGEKFFHLMATLSKDINRYIDLLELMYFCLLLGFGGRYRIMENGMYRLEILTHSLAQQLRKIRGNYSTSLSQIEVMFTTYKNFPQFKIILLVCLLFCGLIFGILNIILGQRLEIVANDVKGQLYELNLPNKPPHTNELLMDILRYQFKEDIVKNNIAISIQNNKIVISLCGRDVFPLASACINQRYKSIIKQIANLMSTLRETVIVRGYSDTQPICTSQYPSNQALSLARAETVLNLLHQSVNHPKLIFSESLNKNKTIKDKIQFNQLFNSRIDLIFS